MKKPFTPVVKISNSYKRRYQARTRTKDLKQQTVAKIYQMAGIKGLSHQQLYNKATELGLNRYLYKNTIVQLDNLLEKIKAL